MGTYAEQPRPLMVVAVDGSASSAAALQWAAHHACAREWRLRVVTAFMPPHLPAELTSNALDHVRAVENHARDRARAVIDAVVGTRATTGWRARLRGSLTNQITGSVSCPVVSVTASGRSSPVPSRPPAPLDARARRRTRGTDHLGAP